VDRLLNSSHFANLLASSPNAVLDYQALADASFEDSHIDDSHHEMVYSLDDSPSKKNQPFCLLLSESIPASAVFRTGLLDTDGRYSCGIRK
jgi:hypothetical protein